MSLLSRDEILAALDIEIQEVDVPEWGGVVRVRGLTGAERDRFEASIIRMQGRRRVMRMKDIRAKLVALTVVDEDGQHLFTETDIPALSEKSAAALQRVVDVAQQLSGITEKDLQELEKNSDTIQSGDLLLD